MTTVARRAAKTSAASLREIRATPMPARFAARHVRLAVCVVCACLLSGCEGFFRDMYDQPKKLPATASPLFPDKQASRPPPVGSVPRSRGDLAGTSSGTRGEAAVTQAHDASQATNAALPASMEVLKRGRERFEIYCMPCHSMVGDGDGRVVRRGFPSPPSFHIDRLRQADDLHFYDVITHGYGVMYPYADRVERQDRWAIVAYIRALQLSQHAPVAELPDALKATLDAMPVASGASPEASASSVTAARTAAESATDAAASVAARPYMPAGPGVSSVASEPSR